jgi:hypothetical protein
MATARQSSAGDGGFDARAFSVWPAAVEARLRWIIPPLGLDQ